MTSEHSSTDGPFAELSRLLWQQRELIADLEYRLEVQQCFMISARPERLNRAVGEVEIALEAIRDLEAKRDQVVTTAANTVGLPGSASLSDIRDAAPAPWDEVLSDHQAAFLDLVTSTEDLSRRNRELAQRGLADTQSVLRRAQGDKPTATYGKGGRASGGLNLPPSLVDHRF